MTATLVLQLRDEGRLALDDPLDRHLPGTAVGGLTLRQLLGHASGLHREPDGAVVGADRGRRPGHPARRPDPDKVGYPACARLPLLQPGVRAARRRCWSGSPGRPGRDCSTQADPRPAGHAAHHLHPTEPFARGYVVHPWHDTLREEPRTDTGAMAPAGQLWSTVDGPGPVGGVPRRPRPRGAGRRHLDRDVRPGGDQRPGLLDRRARPGPGAVPRAASGCTSGHGGSMPGYVAALTVHRPSRDRRGRLRQLVRLPHRSHRRARPGNCSPLVLDAEPTPVAPWRPAAAAPPGGTRRADRPLVVDGHSSTRSGPTPAGDLVVPADPATRRWRFTPDRPGPLAGPLRREGRRDPRRAPRRRPGGRWRLDIATFVFTRTPDQEP